MTEKQLVNLEDIKNLPRNEWHDIRIYNKSGVTYVQQVLRHDNGVSLRTRPYIEWFTRRVLFPIFDFIALVFKLD